MIVYYRIRNAKGEYWSANDPYKFGSFRAFSEAVIFPDTKGLHYTLRAAKELDPTARIVKVTVTRKVQWPVERAKAWLLSFEQIDSEAMADEYASAFAASEADFRHALAVSGWIAKVDVDAAVADVLGEKP